LTVEDTTGSNNLHILASQWGLLATAQSCNSWNQDGGWDISSVSTTLTTLCADDINTESKALGNVLGVTDHVHVEDTVLVELVDDGLWWHADSGNEELSAGLDDDINELAELALGVVVVGLSCIATNLWEQQIDTERSVLVVQEALQLCNLFPEHVWGVSDATDDTETAGIGDCGSKFRAGGNVHASKDDGVVDLQEIRRDGLDLLWRSHCAVICEGKMR